MDPELVHALAPVVRDLIAGHLMQKKGPPVYSMWRNTKDPMVRHVQEALAARGFDIDVDGIYGPRTQAAVSIFQAQAGLERCDGVVGEATIGALFGSAAA